VNKERQISRWTHQRFLPSDWGFTIPTWSPDGAYVAVVGLGDLGDNGTPIWSSHIHVIDVATGKRTTKRMFGNRPRYGGQIEALAWSPSGLRLATAAANGTVKVLEPQQGNELLTLHVEGESCALISWSPDGNKLAAVNDAGVIQIWDSTRGYEFVEGGSRSAELAWVYYDQATKMTDELQTGYLRRALELAPKILDYRLLCGHAMARLKELTALKIRLLARICG